MASIKSRLIREQWRWASEAGLEPDARGYLPSYELNLYKPLSRDLGLMGTAQGQPG
jgi:hypothetical protein